MKGDEADPGRSPVRTAGPWPFITRRSFQLAGQRMVWLARQHRKGLRPETRARGREVPPVWQSEAYNWSIGAGFAAGAFLFMLGSVMSLAPAGVWRPSAFQTNVIFFLGSIPFTTAAYLQLFQAANAGEFDVERARKVRSGISLIGWFPSSPGWLSAVTQFVGTVAFNISTFDAIVVPSQWAVEDLAVWGPDMAGSVLFLVSGYLAFIETGDGYLTWKPKQLAWRIVFVNLIGCVAFMVAAILGYAPRRPEASWIGTVSTVYLLIGALCFFVAAILTMWESSDAGQPLSSSPVS